MVLVEKKTSKFDENSYQYLFLSVTNWQSCITVKGWGGVKNPQNVVNVVYGCPLEKKLKNKSCFHLLSVPPGYQTSSSGTFGLDEPPGLPRFLGLLEL